MPRPETDRETQPAMVSDETAASLPTPDVAAPGAATVLTPLPSNTDLPVASTSIPSSLPSVPLIQQQETLQLLQAGRAGEQSELSCLLPVVR